MLTDGQIVLSDQIILVQAQKSRHRANEAPVENSARQDFPLLIFERFKEASTDPRCRANFSAGNATHFALSLEALAEIPFTHAPASLHELGHSRRASQGCQIRRECSLGYRNQSGTLP